MRTVSEVHGREQCSSTAWGVVCKNLLQVWYIVTYYAAAAHVAAVGSNAVSLGFYIGLQVSVISTMEINYSVKYHEFNGLPFELNTVGINIVFFF